IDCRTIGGFFGVNGKKLQRQYKKFLSSFSTWAPREHAHEWIIYPENIGTHLSIDEVALSQGELFTIVTNKEATIDKLYFLKKISHQSKSKAKKTRN
ncbi:hypothetical protein NJT12_18425, partial [Flavobacterium sp. AC]|nr:hypothetical protein [Flavobacterium azizsancarii]